MLKHRDSLYRHIKFQHRGVPRPKRKKPDIRKKPQVRKKKPVDPNKPNARKKKNPPKDKLEEGMSEELDRAVSSISPQVSSPGMELPEESHPNQPQLGSSPAPTYEAYEQGQGFASQQTSDWNQHFLNGLRGLAQYTSGQHNQVPFVIQTDFHTNAHRY